MKKLRSGNGGGQSCEAFYDPKVGGPNGEAFGDRIRTGEWNSLYQEFENVNRMKFHRYNFWWIYLEFTVVFLKPNTAIASQSSHVGHCCHGCTALRGISFWTPKGSHCALLRRATCDIFFRGTVDGNLKFRRVFPTVWDGADQPVV